MNAAASALGEHRFKLIAMASIPYPYRTRRKLYLVNFFVDTKMNYTRTISLLSTGPRSRESESATKIPVCAADSGTEVF